jgi:hypothetical protein
MKALPLHILTPMQQHRRGNMAARASVKDDLMKAACWGLDEARAQAQRLLAQQDRRLARQLVAAISTSNPEQRVRAADVARRVTERDVDFLVPHAAEIASILADTPIAESRTRWHLELVAARSARPPQQIRLAAEILWQLAEGKSKRGPLLRRRRPGPAGAPRCLAAQHRRTLSPPGARHRHTRHARPRTQGTLLAAIERGEEAALTVRIRSRERIRGQRNSQPNLSGNAEVLENRLSTARTPSATNVHLPDHS